MTRRHHDALVIQQGACNPSGVARALVQAIDEARAECSDTDSVRRDPAVRLICHQLAFLLGAWELEHDLTAYGEAIRLCKDAVAAETAHA